jgi:hypothetical protein
LSGVEWGVQRLYLRAIRNMNKVCICIPCYKTMYSLENCGWTMFISILESFVVNPELLWKGIFFYIYIFTRFPHWIYTALPSVRDTINVLFCLRLLYFVYIGLSFSISTFLRFYPIQIYTHDVLPKNKISWNIEIKKRCTLQVNFYHYSHV